jgi:hypothetical protein
MTLATFFLYPEQLGGVIGLCAGHCAKVDFATLDLPKKRLTPIWIYLAEKDHLVDFTKTNTGLTMLFESLKLNYTIKSDPDMPHRPVSEKCLKEVSTVLH